MLNNNNVKASVDHHREVGRIPAEEQNKNKDARSGRAEEIRITSTTKPEAKESVSIDRNTSSASGGSDGADKCNVNSKTQGRGSKVSLSRSNAVRGKRLKSYNTTVENCTSDNKSDNKTEHVSSKKNKGELVEEIDKVSEEMKCEEIETSASSKKENNSKDSKYSKAELKDSMDVSMDGSSYLMDGSAGSNGGRSVVKSIEDKDQRVLSVSPDEDDFGQDRLTHFDSSQNVSKDASNLGSYICDSSMQGDLSNNISGGSSSHVTDREIVQVTGTSSPDSKVASDGSSGNQEKCVHSNKGLDNCKNTAEMEVIMKTEEDINRNYSLMAKEHIDPLNDNLKGTHALDIQKGSVDSLSGSNKMSSNLKDDGIEGRLMKNSHDQTQSPESERQVESSLNQGQGDSVSSSLMSAEQTNRLSDSKKKRQVSPVDTKADNVQKEENIQEERKTLDELVSMKNYFTIVLFVHF